VAGPEAHSPGAADWLLRLEQVRYAPQPAQQLGTLRREFNTLSWPQPTPGHDLTACSKLFFLLLL
jgi:hypothetical protein